MRNVREDRARRGARPRRAGGHLHQLLPATRSHLQQMPAAAPLHLRGDQPAGLPLVLATGHRRLRALRAATGRRRPAGRKDRFATRATARPCTTGGHAHGAGSSACWSPRPARALTLAPIAPGSRSSAPAPAAAPKTSSTRRGAARDARCAAGAGSCWPIPPAPSRRPWPARRRRSQPPASLASP